MRRELIPGYPDGSDLTVIDVIYHGRTKDEDTGKWSRDFLIIIYKDNQTGEKKSCIINEPEFRYYILKDEYIKPYHQFFVPRDQLIEVEVKYHDLKKDICKRLNLPDEMKFSNEIHADVRLFESDIRIDSFYRMEFNRRYTNMIIPVSKAYLDIEVDIKYCKGSFPEPGECPINAVSYLDNNSKSLVTVLLRDLNNPLIEKFEKGLLNSNFDAEFKSLMANTIGEDNLLSYGLDKLKFKIVFYDEEIKMLADLFGLINTMKPDFLLAWNMAFDIPYIIARIKTLGYDPRDIMCDQSIGGEMYCNYVVDENHLRVPEQRGDYANITSTTVYLDQMIQFASRRKGQSVYASYKLDSIGEAVAKVNKLDYSSITVDLGELPYLDYKVFVMYNMMDVIVQYCIENKTGDISYVFNKAIQNCTPYSKVHRQTVYLANRAIIRFKEYGDFILGNNVNRFKPKNPEKYEGAFVSDPLLISDEVKSRTTMGTLIPLVQNVIDYDFTRMYPSITQQFNLAPNTQIGYITIPTRVYKDENRLHNPKFTRSGAFIEDFTSDNYLEFCRRWFNLGNFKEVYLDIMEYFSEKEIPFYTLWDHIYHYPKAVIQKIGPDDCLINVVYHHTNNRNMSRVEPLSEHTKEEINKLFDRSKLNVSGNGFTDNQ